MKFLRGFGFGATFSSVVAAGLIVTIAAAESMGLAGFLIAFCIVIGVFCGIINATMAEEEDKDATG